MSSNGNELGRGYRRGAVMGLTIAEAFILITFALLLLFAFWQWEVEQENTQDVQTFRELPIEDRETFLDLHADGTLEAIIVLSNNGFDFRAPDATDYPQDKWRFIDQAELNRLLDGAEQLPEDLQRNLANLVQSEGASEILREMALLEELVNSGKTIAEMIASSEVAQAITDSGQSVEDLLQTARLLEQLAQAGQSLDDVIATAELMAVSAQAGETLAGISNRIRDVERQEAALVSAIRDKLGELVGAVGGQIDDTGAIILPDAVLFEQGQSQVTPILGRFLAQACKPWLTVLRDSGVELAEVKIEGHASSEWRVGSSPREAYLGNLDLSQRRSQAVLRLCLDLIPDDEPLLAWARERLMAVGYSSAHPVLRDGEESQELSRRVVLSAEPDRQRLLDDIEVSATYDRASFGEWLDANDDCLDTRDDVLREQSMTPVSLAPDRCRVVEGLWQLKYSGDQERDSSLLHVDHVVPLRWAWEHGADAWPPERQSEFYNDSANLVIARGTLNQEKGAQGLDEWMPPLESYQCAYAQKFNGLIAAYGLVLDESEQAIFQERQDQAC